MLQPKKENTKVLSEESLGENITPAEARKYTQEEATQQQEQGLDEGNTNLQAFHESIIESDFGSSQYDDQKLTLRDTNESIQEHRYDLQTKWDKTGNSLVRTSAGVGLKLLDGIAFTGAMIDNGIQGKFDVGDAAENQVSKYMKSLEDRIDEALPIYKPANYDSLGFYDKIMHTNGGFFFDETAEAFEFIGSTALSTNLGSGLINAGLKSARLLTTSLGNINKIKKSANLFSKASKTFDASKLGSTLEKAKNLSIFGEKQGEIYKALSDATTDFVKNNVITKETALNLYNTAVEAGMEGHEVAKQYLDGIEEAVNAKQKKEWDERVNKIQNTVGISDEEKQIEINNLRQKQAEEKQNVLNNSLEEAKRRANNTFVLNAVALYGPNMIQTKALLGSIGSSREGIQKFGQSLAEVKDNLNKVNNSYLKELGKSYLRNTPSEFGQEVIQKGISDYQSPNEFHPDTKDDYFNSGVQQVIGSINKAVDGFASQETAETALITALITAPTSFIDASHRTKASEGEVASLNKLLENADKAYLNYKADMKSVYKTDIDGNIITDPKTNEPIIDQDIVDRNIYGQISDFATALETSDAILNNDETRLNLIKGRALASMAYEYASMGDNGSSLAQMVIDDKVKEAQDAGNEEESRYISNQKRTLTAYIDAYNRIEKMEGTSVDLLEPSNDKENSDTYRDFIFHKKYKKSLYHQAATRLNIQNAIAENNSKIAILNQPGNQDPVANEKLAKENETLGKSLQESFKISNEIKANYNKMKNSYYKKVDSTIKNQAEIKKLNDQIVALQNEKTTVEPERAVEIDNSIQQLKDQAAGIGQVINQDAKYSGISQSAISEDIVRQPFANLEDTSVESDYAEKTVGRTRFLDNKYKLLQAQYNDVKSNNLTNKIKIYNEDLEQTNGKIATTQDQLQQAKEALDQLTQQANDPSLYGESKDDALAQVAQAQEQYDALSQQLDSLMDNKFKLENKLFYLNQDNPVSKKTFNDYEDLRELAQQYQKESADNFDDKIVKEAIQSVNDDWNNVISPDPLELYHSVLEGIRVANLSEDQIIDNLTSSINGFKKFKDFVFNSYSPFEIEEIEDSFDDIDNIAENIKTIINYASKVKSDSKFGVTPDKLPNLFIQLEHEQLISISEDYATKSISKGIVNPDFVDVEGLLPLKENLVVSIESLKLDSRKDVINTPQYSGDKGIRARLDASLKSVNNLITIAKANKANRELRQEQIKTEYSQKQARQITRENSYLNKILNQLLPQYKNILNSDPVDGINVLLEKIRTNPKVLSEVNKAIEEDKKNYNLEFSQYTVNKEYLKSELLRNLYELKDALEFGNFRYSNEFRRLANNLRVSKPELDSILDLMEGIEALDTIDKSINNKYTLTTALAEESSVIEASSFAPSAEQVIAIRELLMFLTSDKNIAYQQGSAGTGKSTVVIPNVLKIAKKLGLYTSDQEVYSFGHTNRTSEGIANATSSVKGSTREFLEMTPEEFDKYSIIIIDEFPMLDFNSYMDKINSINANRSKPIKVITLGDYNQNTLSGVIPLTYLNIGEKVNLINPLTIKYRSNNEAINNLSDFFENSNTKVNKITGISNVPLGTRGIQGTAVTNNLGDLINQIRIDSDNTSKVVVVASNITNEINTYKKQFEDIGLDIDVLSTREAQGITVERVYTIGPAKTDYYTNTSVYTAISRASQFSMLYMPTALEIENFTNPSDAEYLARIQEERDSQIAKSKNKYGEEVEKLAGLLDSFGVISKVKEKVNAPILQTVEEIENTEDDVLEESEDLNTEDNLSVGSKGDITVTYPESKQIKYKNVNVGDSVTVRKTGDAYRVIQNSTKAILGYIFEKDLPAAMVDKLNSGETVDLEVASAKHIDFIYEKNTNDTGDRLVLDKIQTVIDSLFEEGEEKPSARDVLDNSTFSIVTTSLDPARYKVGTIKLALDIKTKSKKNLSINFNQINSKDFKGEFARIKTIQDFRDKISKLDSLLPVNSKFGTSLFATIINTAANNLEVTYDIDGKPVISNKSVLLSEEEFKNTYSSLSKNTLLGSFKDIQLQTNDMQSLMSLATDIASMYFGPKRVVIDFKNVSNVSDINSLNAYDKNKYEIYKRYINEGLKPVTNSNGSVNFKVNNEPVKTYVVASKQGPLQRAFNSIVLTNKVALEGNGMKYTYSKRDSSGNFITTGLPLISTNQNLLVLDVNNYIANQGIDAEVYTPEEAYTFMKDVLNKQLSATDDKAKVLDRISALDKQYNLTTNKDYQSISLNYIDNILSKYADEGLRIPTNKADIKRANESLENKIELSKKLSSNFIGVVPTTLTLKSPGLSKNFVVTTTVEEVEITPITEENISSPTVSNRDNISNLLDNSENFNCS